MKYLFRGFHPCENGTKTVTIDGKQIKGEWLEGNLRECIGFDNKPMREIEPNNRPLPVIYETVGQWTGLTDKNGVNVFSDDIIKIGEILYIMKRASEWWSFQIVSINTKIKEHCTVSGINQLGEVIGNVHENLELLEG